MPKKSATRVKGKSPVARAKAKRKSTAQQPKKALYGARGGPKTKIWGP